MSDRASARWPRPFIIQLHQKAIDEGCCRAEGLDEPTARSLIASFNRIRRRGDTVHKLAFIPPEFHMVVPYWEKERGSVLFVYNAVPDDMVLPQITSIANKHMIAPGTAAKLLAPAEVPALDVGALLDEMVANSQEGLDEPSSPFGK